MTMVVLSHSPTEDPLTGSPSIQGTLSDLVQYNILPLPIVFLTCIVRVAVCPGRKERLIVAGDLSRIVCCAAVTVSVTGVVWEATPVAAKVIVPEWVPTVKPTALMVMVVSSHSPVDVPLTGSPVIQATSPDLVQLKVPPPVFLTPIVWVAVVPCGKERLIVAGILSIAGAGSFTFVNTCIGLCLSIIVPSPSCPAQLPPQAQRVPSALMASE